MESFKGKTQQDLQSHIEPILFKIKCVVKVPNRERSPVFNVNFKGKLKKTKNHCPYTYYHAKKKNTMSEQKTPKRTKYKIDLDIFLL